MSDYEKAAIHAANIAQTKYKKTPLHEPWPIWEIAREKALSEFIKVLRNKV